MGKFRNGFTESDLFNVTIQNVLTFDSNFDNQEWNLGENKITDNLDFDRNLSTVLSLGATQSTFSGDLIVDGALIAGTVIGITNLAVVDNLIEMGISNTTDLLNLGSIGRYNDGVDTYTGWIRDVNDGKFKLIDSTLKPTNTNSISLLAELEVKNINLNSGESYKINDVNIISSTTLESSVINSSLTSNTGNLLNTGTLEVRTDTNPTLLLRDAAGMSGGEIFFGSLNHGVGRGSNRTNFTQVNDVVLATAGTVGGGAPGDIGLLTEGGYVKLESESGRFGINIDPSFPLDVVGDINTTTDYNISGTQVLSSTTLGTAVINSSLTSVGILTNLNASGDVLISGNSPNLIISNDLEDKSGIEFNDSAAPTTQHFKILFDASSQKLEIESDETEGIMVFLQDGKVGLGTTTPNQLFHINQKSINSNAKVKFTNNESILGVEFGINGSDGKFQVKNRDNKDIDFYTNDSKRMTIGNDGNIGINNGNPNNILDIGGSNLDIINFVGAGSSDRLHLQIGDLTNEIQFGKAGANGDFFTGTIDGDAILRSNLKKLHLGVGTASAPTITMDVSLNVGIGTVSPNVKLDVVGDINTTTDYNISGTQVLSSNTLGVGIINSSLTNLGTLTALTVSNEIITNGVDVTTGNNYQINNISVLSSNTLGVGINNSSLTNLGTLTALTVSNEIITNGVDVTTGNNYQINNISVLSSNTLGVGINNSSLTSNTGNLLNTGTLEVRTDINPTLLLRDNSGTSGGEIYFGNSGHGVGRGSARTNFTQVNDVVMATAGTVGGGAPGDIGLITSGGYVKLESESGKFGINIDPLTQLDVNGVATIRGNLLPGTTNTFDLGTTGTLWRDLYLSGSTIHLGTLDLTDNSGVLAVNGNDVLDGDIHYLEMDRTTTQSVATALNIDTIDFNTTRHTRGGITESVGVFTFPTTGLYTISYVVSWAFNSTGYRRAEIVFDGTAYGFNFLKATDDTPFGNGQTGSTVVNVDNVTKTLTIDVQQSSGGNLNVESATITIARIGNSV